MGAPKDDDSLDAKRQWCIDPNNSVVVTACAGSGKTWLLTSRILRIILNDPKCEQLHRILAITFTNNAAAEIQTRVRERLHKLAYEKDEEERKKLFEEIGVPTKKRSDIASIYRAFLTKRPALSVFTFHSWFNHLIHFLPWGERASFHSRVADSPEYLKQRAWEQMLGNIKDGDEAEAMSYLLGMHKLSELQKSLVGVINNRAEWYLYFGCSPEDKAKAGDKAESKTEDKEEDKDAFSIFQKKMKPEEEWTEQDLLNNKGFLSNLNKLAEEMVDLKKRNHHLKNARDKLKKSQRMKAEDFFITVCKILFEGETVVPNVTKGEDESLKSCLAEILSDIDKVKARYNYIYNKHCARIGLLYAREYAKLKEQEGVIDYADMEFIPLRAISEGRKGTECNPLLLNLFERLDNYKHILVDEFQDTNPVQWRILHAWLEESKGGNQPKVFIVGDPKQSIFSWRGGNPKLLGVARDYLKENYGGEHVRINHTRRCSQKIVDAVNEVFGEGGLELDGFKPHEVETKEQKNDSSLVYRFQPEDFEISKPESVLRDPLDPQPDETDNKSLEKSRREGAELADKIIEIQGSEKGEAKKRRYKDEDIMLLHPRRSPSTPLIEALAGKNLTCSPLDKSKRMDCLECQDILALLHAIFDPGYGLMVAQVLRSPIFGVSEDDLWKVYQAGLFEKDDKKYCSWVVGLKEAKGSSNLKRAKEKLQDWRDSYRQQKLPAHELLAQCYKDAEVIERYVAAVPKDITKRVVLNLDWILNYSLDAQGGRLVLPSEYAAHLRELSEAGEETDMANEGGEIIRSLTVHGAKGLESKIVIVTNSIYRRKGGGGARLLVTWDLEQLHPGHLSFYRNKDSKTKRQEQALEKLEEARRQEENNLLYVAMTRARQHLFFSKQPNTDNLDNNYIKWWDHIKCSDKDGEKKLDSLQPWKESSSANKTKISKRRWPDGESKPIKTGKRNKADNEAKIKGTQRHNLLALILQNNETHEKVMDNNQLLHRRLLGIGKDRLTELHGEIKKILAPETEFGKLLAQVDKKKNPIECELSAIVDGEHKDQVKIRRIDCLLTTKDDVVWIIDFKTGGSAFEDEHKNEYDEQLRAYHSVVKGSHLKDKTIKMAIVDREGGMREVQPA